MNNDPIVDEEPVDPAGSRNHGTMTLSTVAGLMPGAMVAPAPNVEVVLARTEHLTEEVPFRRGQLGGGPGMGRIPGSGYHLLVTQLF